MIDGRNFYDQPINDLIKQYDEERHVSLGKRMTILQDVYYIMHTSMTITG